MEHDSEGSNLRSKLKAGLDKGGLPAPKPTSSWALFPTQDPFGCKGCLVEEPPAPTLTHLHSHVPLPRIDLSPENRRLGTSKRVYRRERERQQRNLGLLRVKTCPASESSDSLRGGPRDDSLRYHSSPPCAKAVPTRSTKRSRARPGYCK